MTLSNPTIVGIVTATHKDGANGRSNGFGLQQLAHAQPGAVQCYVVQYSEHPYLNSMILPITLYVFPPLCLSPPSSPSFLTFFPFLSFQGISWQAL